MIQEYQVRVMPQVAYNEENIKAFIAKDKGIEIGRASCRERVSSPV